ncbi:MAG: type II toxin-antitoxin system RelE/ParE family toxin [Deltaproteobacteria bacterium]|nr:type II toxin-antitoxin system RelE/ParE family toxin [Deltaproteobacteria bacterium]NND29450.1 type II toxin-antitoxin system RelE/ParE family toxin [Myxococcales bacterium]MBT8465776.1 type II toxin-antitoxin system RelE/ParE family toxin [Deltaproteobacteria bacterium]MBT8482526.1 type II toxin-antitoxin system RelE/ParE family toxin [Deltaproteobacteria bacterium]NNK06579.1 type II toxin-antitoxin system RelE/ParE family toxin [Myxococcales bacterium]
MGLTYRIEYLRTVVESDIPALPKSAKRQIRRAIEQKLTTHPFELGKPLRYSLRGARRLRVGDYRVIYRIEPPDVVLVVKIGHRREVYEE